MRVFGHSHCDYDSNGVRLRLTYGTIQTGGNIRFDMSQPGVRFGCCIVPQVSLTKVVIIALIITAWASVLSTAAAAGLHKSGRKFRQEINKFSCASIADVHLRMMAPTLTTLLAVVIHDIAKAKAPAAVAALCFKCSNLIVL